MSINIVNRYPRVGVLLDKAAVTLRPMSRADESALVEFFKRIPPGERYFLKDDVTSPQVIRGWIDGLDFEFALPLLALDGHKVVGDAVLLRHRSASLRHAGEIRVVVDPEFRKKGLAVTLMSELIDVARDSGLEEVAFEFVRGIQGQAIEAAEFLQAEVAAELKGWVRDEKNRPHDVVFLKRKL